MKFIHALFTAALCLTPVAAHADAARPSVSIESGTVIGVRTGSIETFKGIPYAAPPVGPLRWEPPTRPAAWSAPRDATTFGASCPQAGRPDGVQAAGAGGPQSEDCLSLNVWTFEGARRAPVMVWIHGGAFRFGSSSGPFYNGSDFARDGVILVSINYRLGALGFFAHPALTRAASPDAPLGNYGIMDQIAALQWVQRNIAAFGGDPSNVTVFGESAGGSSILALMTIPSTHGLYAKAIVESGGGWGANKSLAAEEKAGVATAGSAGLGGDVTADQLRALSPDKLFGVPSALGGVGPFEDGRLIRLSPTQTFAQGAQVQVPLIIGSNNFEASLMTAFRIPPAAMAARVPAPVRALYPAGDDQAGRQIFTDAVMGAPAQWIASRASQAAPVFLYHFSYVPSIRRASAPGAAHGGEIPFVFGAWPARFDAAASAQDHAMEERLHACWVTFAKTGQPRCGDQAWPPLTADADVLMEFGDASGPVTDFRKAQYEALKSTLLPAYSR